MEVEILLASAPNSKENVAICWPATDSKALSFLQEKDCGVACALKGLPYVAVETNLHDLHVIGHDVGVNDALTQT